MSVISHGSAGGMSRKTYSKKCTGLEEMRNYLKPWRVRDGDGDKQTDRQRAREAGINRK